MASGIFNLLFGNKDQTRQLPTLNKSQMGGLENILSQLGMMGGQGGGYNQAQDFYKNILGGDTSQFEAPYLQNFNQNIIPGIAERFAGYGPQSGALSSSGFGQALGAAGGQLQSQLAALRGQLQQNAAGSLTNQYNQLANLGLGTRPFENAYQPGSTGLVGNALGGFSQGIGQAGGMGLLMKLLPLLGIS